MATDTKWYSVGTASTSIGSKTVTGTGTVWSTQVKSGDIFTLTGDTIWEVESVTNDTTLVLKKPYTATATNVAYAVIRNFTSTLPAELAAQLAEMQRKWYASLTDYVSVLTTTEMTSTITNNDGTTTTVPSWKAITSPTAEQVNQATAARDAAVSAKNASEIAKGAAEAANTSAQSANTSAQSAKDTAVSSAASATASEASALASKTASATSEVNAKASETLAQKWATQTSAEVVTGQGYGAKKYANDANTSFLSFDTKYLGAKATAPTLDNQGGALTIGALYFNTTNNVLYTNTATGWTASSSTQVSTLDQFKYIATAGQTVFTGADANARVLAYNVNAVVVYVNGVRLDNTDFTASSGNSITLAKACTVADEVRIDSFAAFQVANALSLSGGTLTGPVTLSGDATQPLHPMTKQQTELRIGTSGALSWRNKIINGGCQVAQRGSVNIVNASFQYGGSDRHIANVSATTVTSGTITQATGVSKSSSGFAFGVSSVSTTGATTGGLLHRVEAANAKGLNNKTVTMSVTLYHDFGATVNFSLSINKPTSTDTFSSVSQVGAAATVAVPNAQWTRVTATWVLGATDASNGLELRALFPSQGALSNKSYYWTDIQLEEGSVATPFEQRPYGVELALCQRYYETGSVTVAGWGSATNVYKCINLPVSPKRIDPTFTYYDNQGTVGRVTGRTDAGSSTHGLTIGTAPSMANGGNSCALLWDLAVFTYNGINFSWTASAEL